MRVFPKLDARPRRSARALRSALSSLLTLVLGLAGVWITATPASAAPTMSITPITWNIVGLDHNQPVIDGPDTFASGARVCNTGDAPATNVVSTYVWDSANSYINTTGLTTLSVASLAAGACTDFYYNVVVTRTAAAFGTARRFHITATADGLGTVSTPTPREIYIEQLRSQNRNQITSITGPSNVVVGNTYTYVLTSDTSSSFEQWSSFLNFPNFAFQIVSVSATYTQPAGATNSTIYADGCGFQQNPTLADYRECVGPPNFPGGAVGGTAVTTYQVRILSSGAFGINALIYDKSGGSYHYNSDWGNGGQSVTAVEEVDLSITKFESADPVIAGTNLTYTLNVTNAGPSTAHNVTISDPLPAGTSFVSASNGGTNTAGTVSWAIGDLAAGASASRTLTVNVDASRQAALSNTASVATTTTDTNPANNSVTQGTTVNTSADLSLTKIDTADPVARGSNVSYTLTAANSGPSDAQTVQIVDALPAGVAFVSATPSQGTCSESGGTVTCPMGTVTAGANATVALVVTPNADGVITNSAVVSSPTSDPANANNSASQGTTIQPRANLSVTKSDSVDPVVAGQNVTYTITAANGGPSTAQNVQITDTIPAGTSFVSASGSYSLAGGVATWSIGDLASGESASRTLTVQVNPSRIAAISNTAQVSTTTTDPAAGNDEATEGTAVSTSADLSLTKTDDVDPVGVGSDVTYTLTVHNAGPSDAVNVSLSDPLPAGVSFDSATPSQGTCSFAAGTVSCALGTIAAGADATVDVVVSAKSDGAVTNSATVSSTTSDPAAANNSASQGTTIDPRADLSISKTDSADPAVAGTDVTYSLTVTNEGPSTAQNVRVTDALPVGTSFVSASGGGTPAGGNVTWDLGSVAAGATVIRTLTVHVAEARLAPLSNTASVTTTTTDLDPSDDSDTEGTAVSTSADLSVTKVDAADPVAAGDDVTYTISVDNAGPSDALGVVLDDPLPAGLTFVSANTSQGSCGEATGIVSCALGTIADGADATVTIVATAGADGSLSNTATVGATTTDPVAANDSAVETTDVTPVSDLALTKNDGAPSVAAGMSTTYTLTLSNAGPNPVPSGVEITDTLPAGVTVIETEPDCTVAGSEVTCETTADLLVGDLVEYELEVLLDPGFAAAIIDNTAEITGTPHVDPDPSDDEDTDTNVVEFVADLGVTVSDAVDPVDLGGDVVDTITVTNDGPSDAADVVVLAPVPAGVTVSTLDAACSLVLGGTVIRCAMATLVNGGSESFDVTLTPTSEGVVSVTAGVASAADDPNAANDSDTETTTVDPVADVSITKTAAPAIVGLGEDATYELAVHNDGPSTARNVEVVDVLPTGVAFESVTTTAGTCSEAAGTVTCVLGDLVNGATETVQIVVTTTVEGPVTNLASVTSDTGDPDVTDDASSDGVVVTPRADLEVTKDDGLAYVVAGTSTSYTITLTNHGPSDVPAGVEVTDSAPADTTLSTTHPGCASNGADVVCTTGAGLAAGDSVSFAVDLAVDSDHSGPTLANTAAVTSTPVQDPDASNDNDTDTAGVGATADLSVSVDDVVDPVDLGEDITYEILVSNDGPSDAANVDVEAPLPVELAFAAADPGCSFAGGVVTCSLPTLAAGAAHTFTVVASPLAATTVTLPVAVSSDATDPDASDDADAEQTVVDAPLVTDADLAVSIADLADPVPVGGTLAYTISVTNTGPANAFGVEVEQILPAGAAFVSATPSQGSCVNAAGTVTCALGAIAVGDAVTIDVVADAPGVAGTANSGVTVDALSPDPDPSDDADDEDTEVRALSADLSLVKTDLAPSVVAGGWTIYTLTLTNAGPDEAPAGVVITDVAPAGTSPSESEADCSVAGVTLTCTTQAAIPVGGSVVYAVTLSVAPSFAGATLSNSATITGSPVGDPDPSDDVSTDEDVVVRDADLVAGVTDTPDPVVLGNAVTYTLTATNDGPSDAQNAAVTAILPPELTFVSADPACAYDPGLAIVLCDAGTLAPGGVATFDVVLEPTVTGTVALDMVVSTSTPDPDASDDTAVAATTVDAVPVLAVDLAADLADAPDPVNTSGTLAYTLSAQNTGPGDAADVDLVQALPAGVTFVSASADCSHAAGLVTCAVGAINAGATANRAVTVSAPAAVQALSSSVLVTTTSADSDPTNDAATATTSMVVPGAGPDVADVGVTVTDAPDPVDVGGTVTYSVGVTNAGPDDAENTTVGFSLPAGATFTSATPNVGTCVQAAGIVTCDLGTLASGGTTSISVAVVVTTDGTAIATAFVWSDATDGNAANDIASETTTVNPVADLSISKTDGATSVTPGTSPTYTITLSNAGPSAAAPGVVVADPVPAGTTLNGTPPGCSVNAGAVTCTTTAPLAANATVSWQVTLDVPLSYTGVALDNTASIQSSPTTDPVATNDSATDHDDVVAPPADLSIFKEDVPDPVFAGERITYTITVSNAGPGTAEDVVVTDAVPVATTIDEILDGGSESGGVITWNLGTLAAGASATVRLVVVVDVNHDGDVTNVASVASSTTDPDPSDDSATAVTTDDPAGVDLALEKTVDQTSAKPGDVVTYTIVVSNAGPADATGVVIEDPLPNRLHYVSSKADRGSYGKDTSRWLVGDLPAGDDATLEIRARITGAAAETVRNVATVVALDQTDPTPANDRAEADVEVLSSDVEIVDPVTDAEELAYTGWNFGFAVRLALILLLLGLALMRFGRRLERRGDVAG